jgi:hypothetical protein
LAGSLVRSIVTLQGWTEVVTMTEERDPTVEPTSPDAKPAQEPERRGGWTQIEEMERDTPEKQREKRELKEGFTRLGFPAREPQQRDDG